MYKVGESILQYWSERFGDAAISRLFDNWGRARSFEDLVETTFGVPLKVLDREWAYDLKKKYYPELGDLDLPAAVAQPVSPDGFFLAPAPACVADGDSCRLELVYLGNRMGYSALYRQRLPGTSVDPLIKGGRSGRYELLHLFRAGIDANHEGLVAFSSKSSERDVLYFYDLKKKRVVDRRRFEHLVSIVSPAFAPDGQRVVFAGAGPDGQHDLFVLDRRSQDPPLRLTRDIYRDSDPVVTPDGRHVIFASDRGARGKQGVMNLYRIELRSGQITPVTDTTGTNTSPTFLGPDTLLFVSDRAGSYDVYALVADRDLYRVTSLSSGVFSPQVETGTHDMFFSAFTNFGYRIFRTNVGPDRWTAVPREDVSPRIAHWEADQKKATEFASAKGIKKYHHDFSIDIAQSAISYDAVLGTIGGFQLAVSDMLGNESYHFLLSNVASSTADFLTSFNVATTYLNTRHRINYGWGLYHLYDTEASFNLVEGLYRERQAGGLVFLSYPLSKFRRIELTTFVRYAKRDWLTPPRTREGVLATPTLSLVYDNSLWAVTGPIEGIRTNITGGITYNITDGRVLNRLFWADLRHYYRLGLRSAFATRLYAFLSGGEEPVRRYFGGSWDFRGFSRSSFFTRRILFASNELRFPLINRLDIDFPVGRLNFSGIKGALFFDVGSAWDRDDPQWWGSYGFGWRVALGGLMVLRFDLARVTDFQRTLPGWNFDFFFGWNF
jgi:hypothetical protein